MNPALFFSLWITALSTLVSGYWFVHRSYNQAMQKEMKSFEVQWKKWEEKYGKP